MSPKKNTIPAGLWESTSIAASHPDISLVMRNRSATVSKKRSDPKHQTGKAA